MFDKNGYPTEESLSLIKNCDILKEDIFILLKNLWKFKDGYWTEVKKYDDRNNLILHEYHIATGGWSGNEDLIESFQLNHSAWGLYWYQSTRGGSYIFRKNIYLPFP